VTGWLLALGLLLLGDPDARQNYAGLVDQWVAKIELTYAAAVAPREPVMTASVQAQAGDLGALLVEASTGFRRAYAVALDAYGAAMRAEPPSATQVEPLDLGALYDKAAAAIWQAYATTIDDYRTATQGDWPLAPQVHRLAATQSETGDPALRSAITEAANRFDLPELWIRAVMRVESNGDAGAISPKGAMGLMQVMPTTYAYLSDRYGLGDDPYALRDNVLAGSAYLREMYDRYGSSGFIAAYNAGPGRYEDYLGGRDLPAETKHYVASVRLALGEVLFGQPESRFYEPIAISPNGELLLGKTGQPMPADDRLALHSLVARAVQRAAAK
jgi:soluble lytic murein transglycosylase-like protein